MRSWKRRAGEMEGKGGEMGGNAGIMRGEMGVEWGDPPKSAPTSFCTRFLL